MKLSALVQPEHKQRITTLYGNFLSKEPFVQTLMFVLCVVHKPIGLAKLQKVISILLDNGFLEGSAKQFALSPELRDKLVAEKLLFSTREGLMVSRLLTNKLINNISMLQSAHESSDQQKIQQILIAAEEVVPVVNSYSWQNKLVDKQRLIRDYYLLGERELLDEALAYDKNPQIIDYRLTEILVELFFIPFNLEAFLTFSPRLQHQAFATLFRLCQMQGQSCAYPTLLLEQVCNASAGKKNVLCHYLLAEQYLFQLRFKDFESVISKDDTSAYALQLLGAYAFCTGENDAALEYFAQALAAKNKFSRRKKQYINGVLGAFYKLSLIVAGNRRSTSYFQQALDQIAFEQSNRKYEDDFLSVNTSLKNTIVSLQNGTSYHQPIRYASVSAEIDFFVHHLNYLFHFLSHVWCNTGNEPEIAELASEYQQGFHKLSYAMFANVCIQISSQLRQKSFPKHQLLVQFTQLIQGKSRWDVALDKLIALKTSKQPTDNSSSKPVAKASRLIWVLVRDYGYSLEPREQKMSKTGWSKGKAVSLKRLYDQSDEIDFLSASDRLLCKEIEAFQAYGYYGKTEYSLQGLGALNAAVGIDNLYEGGNFDIPIEIIKHEPQLLVTQQGDQLCLSIADLPYDVERYEDGPAYDFKPISEGKYQLTVFSAEHMQVAKIVGEEGLLVPIAAKQKALDGIAAIAPMLNIHSNLEELDTGLEQFPCDPHLVINIQPYEQGLVFNTVVMPFGEQGPALAPAIGSANLSANIDGKRVQTMRDLLREELLLDKLDKACPAFLNMADNYLYLAEPQSALDTLGQLEHALEQSLFELKLRWPKGKKIQLSKKLDTAQLQLSIHRRNEWFEITGELEVNNEQVIELRKLLEMMQTSNGRYIELGNQQILALSDELRQKLQVLDQVTVDGAFHSLASFQIEEATTGMRMKTIDAWEKQTQLMHQSNEIKPQVPSTFKAKLRDYQLIGFDWASRLAHWGAGACLADDMGLGKTLQALAVILARASDGPSLVLAPTSVCFNWQQEAFAFSPTLKIKLFSDASNKGARKALLGSLSANDCLIVSYGLLQRESDLLSSIQWQTIVADEAQALKNPLAKRTKAAYSLQGNFKMITTGTPIENDLSELWSLFRFINPGLLGNLQQFGKRYIAPINNAEEDKLAARKASQGLKTLIQPFILRRLKSQVLQELPSRTEINIPVEMSEDEKTFYEAIRLNALDNISKTATSNQGEQRIRMLAELVRLRQACCNPKLVIAETAIPSAKLAALSKLLEELKANNHKALIFSQFVGHLKLIEAHIKALGFSYQYLDGSTPAKERQQRVNAFQNGEGELFLISLKAGGSGLNLTAADYVIHMDPWWNPAVEDQASDRAHRIGQTRPVTIYRLITQHTIEEKIVALHQQKRDLADTLLSGNDVASKLSVEDMLNMLKETF